MLELREHVFAVEQQMQCNCDLDNWEPERDTGHSRVCRIHKEARSRHYTERHKPMGEAGREEG